MFSKIALIGFSLFSLSFSSIVPRDPVCQLDASSLNSIQSFFQASINGADILGTQTFHNGIASLTALQMTSRTTLMEILDGLEYSLKISRSRDSYIASLPIHDYGFCQNSTLAGVCRLYGFGIDLPVDTYYQVSATLSQLGFQNAKLDIFSNGGLDAYLNYLANRYYQNDFCLPLQVVPGDSIFHYADPTDQGVIYVSCPTEQGAVLRVVSGEDISTEWVCADAGAKCLPINADYAASHELPPSPDVIAKAFMPMPPTKVPKRQPKH